MISNGRKMILKKINYRQTNYTLSTLALCAIHNKNQKKNKPDGFLCSKFYFFIFYLFSTQWQRKIKIKALKGWFDAQRIVCCCNKTHKTHKKS